MLMGLSVAPTLANMSTALMNNFDDRGYILADGLNSLSACFLQLSLGDHFYLVLVHSRMYKFAGSIDLFRTYSFNFSFFFPDACHEVQLTAYLSICWYL